MIIASGKVLLAHRAILAQRSQELREMIEMETPSDGVTPNQPVQILLPELHYDTAKGLLVFIYTDVLPSWCSNNVSILRALSRVGKSLKIPRLQILSDRLLYLINSIEMESFSAQMESGLLIGTLSRDMGAIVGETQFADVRFIAEGRSVLAHRFILECRWEYFRAMFRNMNQSNGSSDVVIDVVVPDTFVGFLRLLIFLYTDTLPDGSDGALLEDIMSADRYNLVDMRTLIEGMLVPSKSNWLDLLRTADSIGSKRLMHMCLCFLRDNFAVLNENITYENELDNEGLDGSLDSPKYESAMSVIKEEFPWLLENILTCRRNLHASSPSKLLINRLKIANDGTNVPKKSILTPLIGIVLIVIALPLYNHFKQYFIIGPMVPIVNTLCVLFILYMMYRKLKE